MKTKFLITIMLIGAVTADAQTAEEHYRSGILDFQARQYPEALSEFNQAIVLNPSYTDALFYRGLLNVHLKEYPAAIKDLDKVLETKADYAEAWFHRASAKKEVKDLDGAIKDLDQAIALKPDYTVAWYIKGLTLIQAKEYKESIPVFDHILNSGASPYTGGSYYSRGLAESYTDQKEAACQDFRKALAAGYKNAQEALTKYCK